jgi:amidase
MTLAPIWQWTAVETALAIRSGAASAESVVAAHLERMGAVNPALNAVVVDLGEAALVAARAADRALAAGEPVGTLHGVPVTIKINVDVEGQANSNGVAAFKDTIAPGDSPVVANLKAAGAIIIGLTNTPEFSMRWFTDNALHGLTRNPWDAAITCGGSSGGAGASVAAGVGTIAHGNDIGGSLRWPASCNGVSTIKPTQGRIAAFNPSAPVERPPVAQLMSCQGPLARTVGDVRLGLEVMSRRDPRDPWWVPAPLVGPPPPAPIKVAVARIPDDMEADPHVKGLIDRAAGWLADAGYAVAEVEIPDVSAAWRLWCDLISTEIATLQLAQMREIGGRDFNQAIDGMLGLANILDGEGYMRAVASRTRLIRDWLAFLEAWPVILAPASVRPTPPVNADLAGEARLRRLFLNDFRFISAINVLGLPSAVTPIGLARGAPVGAQLIASRYREDLALDAAQAIEDRLGVMTRTLWAREVTGA